MSAAKDGFTVKLPPEALEMVEQLIPLGLYGSSRAEIARNLILDQLKLLVNAKTIKLPGAQ